MFVIYFVSTLILSVKSCELIYNHPLSFYDKASIFLVNNYNADTELKQLLSYDMIEKSHFSVNAAKTQIIKLKLLNSDPVQFTKEQLLTAFTCHEDIVLDNKQNYQIKSKDDSLKIYKIPNN